MLGLRSKRLCKKNLDSLNKDGDLFMGCVECIRGDIFIVELKSSEDKHVQKGRRPVVVISSNVNNNNSPTVNVIPLTATIKKIDQPTHVIIKGYGLALTSMTLSEQIITLDKKRLKKYNWIGRIDDTIVLNKIRDSVFQQLS